MDITGTYAIPTVYSLPSGGTGMANEARGASRQLEYFSGMSYLPTWICSISESKSQVQVNGNAYDHKFACANSNSNSLGGTPTSGKCNTTPTVNDASHYINGVQQHYPTSDYQGT